MSSNVRVQEFEGRRTAIRDAMMSIGADAFVTDRSEHIRYLCGYAVFAVTPRPVIAVILSSGELVIIAGGQVAGTVAAEVPSARIEIYRSPAERPLDMILPDGPLQFAPAAFECLRTVLSTAAVEQVAVDDFRVTFPPTTRLDVALTGFNAVDGSDLIRNLRRIKSPWEIEQLRGAALRLASAFDVVVPHLSPGMNEIEIRRRMAIAVLESEAELYFASAIVIEDGKEILGPETDRVWREGELLYIDAGASVEGYTSDFCRTYVAGSPSDAQSRAYQKVLDARDAAISAFRPGTTAGQLASEMTRILGNDAEQVAGRMGHGLGLGLEPPSLNPADPTVMEDGMVFCLEPAVVVDGSYYTLEEEYAVLDGDLVMLSPPAPRQIIAVEVVDSAST